MVGEGVGMCVGGGRRRGIRMSVCLFSRVLGDGWSRITLVEVVLCVMHNLGIVCSVDDNLCPLLLGLLKVKSNYKEI